MRALLLASCALLIAVPLFAQSHPSVAAGAEIDIVRTDLASIDGFEYPACSGQLSAASLPAGMQGAERWRA